jgi:osmotically-inducible protein OsmY
MARRAHRYEGAELAGQPVASTRYVVDRNDGPSEPQRGYGFDDVDGGYGVARVRGQGAQRSDERIEELVCEALHDDGDVDATNITVSSHDGEVTLAGTVEARRMKPLAEACARRVAGVIAVTDQIKVRRQRA